MTPATRADDNRPSSSPRFRVSQLYRLLGGNIAQFRRQAKLTQEELAEKTDYSVDFIGLLERGVNAPALARLEDIARVIRVEVW